MKKSFFNVAALIRSAFGTIEIRQSDTDIQNEVYGIVRRVGYKYYPQSVNNDRTAEIVETLGVCLVESGRSFDPSKGTEPLSWCLGKIWYVANNLWRSYARQDHRTLSDTEQGDRDGAGQDSARNRLFADHGVRGSVAPDTGLEDREVLNKVLGCLSPEEFDIIRMKASGMTLQEIGVRLGVSHVTVWNRLKGIAAKAKTLTHA